MDDIDQHSRREFLGLVGAAAAAAGATSLLPPSIVRALSIPAYSASGTIDDVGHVVILMQENRSFDHYFGTLHGVRGFGDRFTVPLPDGRTVWQQSNGSRIVQPYHLDSTTGNAQRVDGTPHTWGDAHDAWDDGRMSAWPEVKDDWSMGYYQRAEVPFQSALADAFTLCDAYHCSIQAGTNPNRLFLWTGTNGPTGADVAAVVNEWDSLGAPTIGYTWTTYPERLEQAGVTWKVYQSMPDNFGDNSLAGFVNYRRANTAMGNGPDGSPYTVYDEKFEDRRSADHRGSPTRCPTAGSSRRSGRHGGRPSPAGVVDRRPRDVLRAPQPVEPDQGRTTSSARARRVDRRLPTCGRARCYSSTTTRTTVSSTTPLHQRRPPSARTDNRPATPHATSPPSGSRTPTRPAPPSSRRPTAVSTVWVRACR